MTPFLSVTIAQWYTETRGFSDFSLVVFSLKIIRLRILYLPRGLLCLPWRQVDVPEYTSVLVSSHLIYIDVSTHEKRNIPRIKSWMESWTKYLWNHLFDDCESSGRVWSRPRTVSSRLVPLWVCLIQVDVLDVSTTFDTSFRKYKLQTEVS